MSQEKRRQRLVWIGNGMAGMRSVEDVLALEPDSFELTIIGGSQLEVITGSYSHLLFKGRLQSTPFTHRPKHGFQIIRLLCF